MRIKTVVTWILVMITVVSYAQNVSSKFDKVTFYQAISSEEMEKINAQLDIVKGIHISEKEGFEGALLMKKAGLAGGPREKLSLFKSGHKKLEEAIEANKDNIELRFLRLMIQENAPKILGYDNNIQEDAQFIHQFFENISPVVQKVIIDYSKKSKVIKVEDRN